MTSLIRSRIQNIRERIFEEGMHKRNNVNRPFENQTDNTQPSFFGVEARRAIRETNSLSYQRFLKDKWKNMTDVSGTVRR